MRCVCGGEGGVSEECGGEGGVTDRCVEGREVCVWRR